MFQELEISTCIEETTADSNGICQINLPKIQVECNLIQTIYN